MQPMYKLSCFVTLLCSSGLALAQPDPAALAKAEVKLVRCDSGQSLSAALERARPGDVLGLRGSCSGPVSIGVDRITLRGDGSAAISGGPGAVVSVQAARGIVLSGLTIRAGTGAGVLARDGAQLALVDVQVTGNQVGVQLGAAASARVSGGSVSDNHVHGYDVQGSSALTITGAHAITGNGVFGLNVNGGSSLTLSEAKLEVSRNTLGVQLGTGAAGFISDGVSQLTASDNATDGLTIVSGSHFVAFGGAITCNRNGIHGISVNAKAGFDLDGAAQVETNENKGDGLHLEQQAVATFFNNPSFTQQSTPTRLRAERNGAHGVDLQTGSALTVSNVAQLLVSDNAQAGLALDDGSLAAFTRTIPVSGADTDLRRNHPDVSLSFASRLSALDSLHVETASCDASSLVRGTLAVACQ